MELDDEAKLAVRELGAAINAAIESSETVAEAIQTLREIGYEPNLTLKLEIGLRELAEDSDAFDGEREEIELELTEEDVRTLRRMKIKF